MPSKKPARKKVKPRSAKRLARQRILHLVEVGPRGAYWSIKFDGKRIGSTFYKKDALSIADLIKQLALCDGSVSLRVRNQWGRHAEERTFPREADPPSPG